MNDDTADAQHDTDPRLDNARRTDRSAQTQRQTAPGKTARDTH
jgi:hypothetical protein